MACATKSSRGQEIAGAARDFDLTSALPPRHYGPLETHSGGGMVKVMQRLWTDEEGQDIAEYAVMLAVILVLVVGTVRLIGGSSNNVFSSVASSISGQ
jgi:Flp pilus assembly pilin Flp